MRYLIVVLVIFIVYTCRPLRMNDIEFIKSKTVEVEVRGHLENPGIFEVSRYSNFNDLKDELSLYEDSDLEHISLTKTLLDQDVITISKKSEAIKVSINSANQEQLMTLKGIGEKTAQRIIDYRSTSSFKAIEDLMNVKGIGEKIFQNIKDSIIL